MGRKTTAINSVNNTLLIDTNAAVQYPHGKEKYHFLRILPFPFFLKSAFFDGLSFSEVFTLLFRKNPAMQLLVRTRLLPATPKGQGT